MATSKSNETSTSSSKVDSNQTGACIPPIKIIDAKEAIALHIGIKANLHGDTPKWDLPSDYVKV